jgi:hypothetical protein
MVDVMAREWLRQVMLEEAAANGIYNNIRMILTWFYAHDGLVTCQNPNIL